VNGPPSLIQASDGNLWDVWKQDGGPGRVIAISPVDGTVLKSFLFSGANGGAPDASVVQAGDGKLYGTATLGGTASNNCRVRRLHSFKRNGGFDGDDSWRPSDWYDGGDLQRR
jgi:hypothetical protein